MFCLPDLPYKYDALEPYIDGKTMRLHHDKHHAAYVEKLNYVLKDQKKLLEMDIVALLSKIDLVPKEIRQAVVNNGGGHANHSFFWEIMRPHSAKEERPQGELAQAINLTFESFDNFKKQFSEKALGVFGSGWAYLVMTPDKNLALKRQSFQNSPLMKGNIPLLGIDVWEHAYYLKYKNKRADYVEAWWKVVNWDKASEFFAKSAEKV